MTKIYVDRTATILNQNGEDLPVFKILIDGVLHEGNEVLIRGPSRLKYDKKKIGEGKPGVWLETNSEVKID